MSFGRYLSNKYGRQLLDSATKTELDALKTPSKKAAHKAAEATGQFIGNKIANKIVKPKPVTCKKCSRNNIPPEQRKEILDELRHVL